MASGNRSKDVVLWVIGALVYYAEQGWILRNSVKMSLSGDLMDKFETLVKSGFRLKWPEMIICLEILEDEGLIDKNVYEEILLYGLPDQYGVA